jgi:ribosomal protein S18 acetylase RimI-like enzyme
MGEITCFVVAKDHRRSGVATALLRAACDGLMAQGLEIAEALPKAEASSDAQNHFGPLSLYLAAGFQVHRTDGEGRVFVRRSLV